MTDFPSIQKKETQLSFSRGANIVNVLGESVRKFISPGLFSRLIVIVNKCLHISNAFNYSIYTQLVSDKKYHVVACCVAFVTRTFKRFLEILFHVKFSIKEITSNGIELCQSLWRSGIISIIGREHFIPVWSKGFKWHFLFIEYVSHSLSHIMHKGEKRAINNIFFIDDIKYRHQIEVVQFMSKRFGCRLEPAIEERVYIKEYGVSESPTFQVPYNEVNWARFWSYAVAIVRQKRHSKRVGIVNDIIYIHIIDNRSVLAEIIFNAQSSGNE